jgi:hypothetical protein
MIGKELPLEVAGELLVTSRANSNKGTRGHQNTHHREHIEMITPRRALRISNSVIRSKSLKRSLTQENVMNRLSPLFQMKIVMTGQQEEEPQGEP